MDGSFENLSKEEIKEYLDEMVVRYDRPEFIENDPISIPHRYSDPRDQEIAGLFAALFAWGNRKTIINKSLDLMERMGDAPGDFLQNAGRKDLLSLRGFVHRTFSSDDIVETLLTLRKVTSDRTLESIFRHHPYEVDGFGPITRFYHLLKENGLGPRGLRHFSNPSTGSAAKRLNMYLRWMVRRDPAGVDLGIWSSIDPSRLSCPLDVHSGKVARKLGILKRAQNDWRSVAELDQSLRSFDPLDPVKYDFALFGLSAMENF
ncbi:MAG: TIGR02757 family protein [Bacteroidota bacterium]|nr:TIGR02757 family protein [Bacteroidota bacterium]